MTSFTPHETVTIAATTASASATYSTKGRDVKNIQITNNGPSAAYIRFGFAPQTANAATDMEVAPGAVAIYCKGYVDTVAAICATGTAALSISAGEGE